jgi:hypothetical protein
MRPELGNRKRFLFRIILYTLAPLAGLLVLLNPQSYPEGLLLGFIGLVIGLVAQYQLYSRLKNPSGAVKFALRPTGTVAKILQNSIASNLLDQSANSAMKILMQELFEALPDVQIEDIRVTPGDDPIYSIGDEIVIFTQSAPETFADLSASLERLIEFKTPLHDESFFFVFIGQLQEGMAAEINEVFHNPKIFTTP